jgi:hypothetical protein
MCAQKAKFFHEALGLKCDFNAFVGWLNRFKKQYGICEIAVQGERLIPHITKIQASRPHNDFVPLTMLLLVNIIVLPDLLHCEF